MKQKKIAIVGSGGANLSSVYFALKRLNCEVVIAKSLVELERADALILPGVGSAKFAMNELESTSLDRFLRTQEKPILGICLGSQLLCERSEEEEVSCLGVIPLEVKKLVGPRVIPHMGWNNLTQIYEDDLLRGITVEDNFYFIHSFAAEVAAPFSKAICDYYGLFSAVVRRENFFGVQFHPEKSGICGLKILKNLIEIKL